MTNISAVSAAKNQNVGSRANSVRLPNDIEDAIEKFDRLRLVRDHRVDGKRPIGVDRVDEGAIRDLTEIERRDEYRPKFGEGVVRFSSSIATGSRDSDHEQDQDRDNLIERGPIKSQYFSPTRNQPYWTSVANEHSRGVEANDAFLIDYDKTAERILGDKDYGEKLNACLDQLQGLDKTCWNLYGEEKSENLPLGSDATRDQNPLTSATIEGESIDDLLLLESVLCGAFQAAQHATESSFLPASPGTTGTTGTDAVDSLQGDRDPSKSESRESSRAQSPAAVVPRVESPRTSQPCFGQSPIGSPLVTGPSSYRPSQILPYSSSSSSSSSNHSFGDTPSPNGSSSRTTFDSRIAGRFVDDFDNFDNFPLSTEISETSATDNNIDNSDLWSKVMEELVNGLEGDRAKVGLTRTETTVYPNEFQRSVSRSSATMNGGAKKDVAEGHSTEDAAIAQPFLPWETSVIYSTQRGSEMAKRTSTTTTVSGMTNVTTAATTRTTATTNTRSNADYATNANLLSPCRKFGDERASRIVEPDFSALFHSLDNAVTYPDVNDSLCFDDFKTKKSMTHTRDDFDIPKMVACFESRTRRRCNSDRTIIPWPSLNLPSVEASDRLKEKLNPKQVEKAMIGLLKRSVEELAEQDKDGDTTLMCLVGNPDELVHKMAYLVPLVERLSAIPASLTVANDRGEDALYLAALNCPQFPYVAGYLAATMVEKGIDVGQLYYHTRGDTLIHSIAARGDSHVETLAELLALRTVQGNGVFDLSKRNYDGKTALHSAIESHDPLARRTTSVATVKLLLKYGADPRIKETKCGDTALHTTLALGCDPALVKVLLNASAYDLVNAINYNHDTALHVAAAASNTVSLERLREVCWLLMHAGAHANLLNRQGKAPLALVSSERKDVVRKIFCKRS